MQPRPYVGFRYTALVMLNVPPGHPTLDEATKMPLAATSDAEPFAVMVPLEEPDVKLIRRLRFKPASIGCVTVPEIVKVVSELIIAETQEDEGLFTAVTFPARLFPF